MKKTILEQVKLGYSESSFHSRDLFFKHFSILDIEAIREHYEDTLERLLKEGLPSDEDKIKEAQERGLWSESHKTQVSELTHKIKGMNTTLQKAFIPKQVDTLKSRISEAEKELKSLIDQKESLKLGSAESFARRASNEYYLFFSSRDKDGEPFFDQEEFDDLEDSDIIELTLSYNASVGLITPDKLKRIAISPFFVNMFGVCDNSADLFGGTIIDMTCFQTQLIGYAKQFKHVFQNFQDIPPDIQEDPDKLMEWAVMKSNASKPKPKSSIFDQVRNSKKSLGPQELSKMKNV